MAAFQVFLYGRFWVFTEALPLLESLYVLLKPALVLPGLHRVCFDQFDGCRQSQKRSVPFRKLHSAAARRLRMALATQHHACGQCSASDSNAPEERTPLCHLMPMASNVFIVRRARFNRSLIQRCRVQIVVWHAFVPQLSGEICSS
jgi:hypothetical protein